MVLMYKPSVIDPPFGGAPEKALRWDLPGIESCGGEIGFRGYLGCFQGIWEYIGGISRSVELRGAHEGGGAPGPLGHTLLPRGLLASFLTSTPSLLDHVFSKNNSPEGFIPFDIPFLRNTEIGKKTAIWVGPPVNMLVPKIIQKCIINPNNHLKQYII